MSAVGPADLDQSCGVHAINTSHCSAELRRGASPPLRHAKARALTVQYEREKERKNYALRHEVKEGAVYRTYAKRDPHACGSTCVGRLITVTWKGLFNPLLSLAIAKDILEC